MRLTRKQSIFASVAILLLFFVAVSLFRPKGGGIPSATVENSDSEKEEQTSSANSSGPDFVLDNFKREEVRGGKKVWEVKADRGRYNPGGGQAILDKAFLWLYQKDGGLVTLKADKAILKLEGTDGLSMADFMGQVIIVQDNKTTLETDQAHYDKDKDLIQAPNQVKITGDRMQLEGIGMEVVVSTKQIKLLNNTKTKLDPKETNPNSEPTH